MIDTDHGRRHCECVFRPRMCASVPTAIRGKEMMYDARLLGVEPWAVTDRRDSGGFDKWRHMVWRTLAYQHWRSYVENRPDWFTADAIFTFDLQDVAFNRHEKYPSLRALARPQLSLLILFEGLDPPFLRDTLQGLLRTVVFARRAQNLATWLYHFEATDSVLRSPVLSHVSVAPAYALQEGAAPAQLTAGSTSETALEKPRVQRSANQL